MRPGQSPLLLLLGIALGTLGCASAPPPRTGFISDYSNLEPVTDKARYLSPRLAEYHSFIVDPVQIREIKDPPILSEPERAEIAAYFREALVKVLISDGHTVTDEVGPSTARVRLAITDINKSTWWLNLHPGSKLTGAGAGGASMEGEVIDSVTGEQLAAFVKSGTGNQFELDHFDELDDVKNVIDAWAREAKRRFRELRMAQTTQ
ncbi:MAG: DUF3313 domain-containing protein [Planctomycetota bacterium]|jgi:hypothetical protein